LTKATKALLYGIPFKRHKAHFR